MSTRFRILGSSSKGNAAFLATPETRILIDAGFSGKQIEARLAAIEESSEALDAVFLTHEHSDHTAGVRGLTQRKEQLPFFANRDTAREVQSKLKRQANWKIFETGDTFQFRDIEITSFSLPHDAADPVGYVFRCGDGTLFNPYHTVAWVTDLGYAPNLVHEKIREADTLVLESNHDLRMLEDSDRAWSLKQRIKSRHGHLSNNAARELLESIPSPRWSKVYLAHLSGECNCVNVVKETFAPLMNAGQSYQIEVVDPEASVPVVCMPEIRCIFFDIGQVLFHLRVHRFWECMDTDGLGDIGELTRRFVGSGLQIDYEMGTLSSEDFFNQLSELLELPNDNNLLKAWNAVLEPEEENLQIAASLRGRYLTGVISNTNATHIAYVQSEWQEYDAFDHCTYSHEIGFLKPRIEIYQHAIEQTGVAPEESVFFDDREDNVAAARELGIQAYQVKQPAELKQGMQLAGIL